MDTKGTYKHSMMTLVALLCLYFAFSAYVSMRCFRVPEASILRLLATTVTILCLFATLVPILPSFATEVSVPGFFVTTVFVLVFLVTYVRPLTFENFLKGLYVCAAQGVARPISEHSLKAL